MYSRIARKARKGGGIFMYINEELDIGDVNTYSSKNETLQLAACTVTVYNRVVLIITVYNAEGSLDELQLALDNILNKFPPNLMTILLGDVNIDILKQSAQSSDYLAYIGSHGFMPLVNIVTRPGKTGSCIDHILARNHEEVLNLLCGAIDLLTPDHRPVFAAFTGLGQQTHIRPVVKNLVRTRNFSNRNHSAFLDEISTCSWKDTLRHDEAQKNVSAYIGKINEIYRRCFPLRDRSPKVKPRLPIDRWFDGELLRLRNIKDRLANKVKRFGLENDKRKLRALSKEYARLCRSKRKCYFESKFNNADLKGKWILANALCGRNGRKKTSIEQLIVCGETISDKNKIASILNSQFSNKAQTIVESRYGSAEHLEFNHNISVSNSTIEGAPPEAFRFRHLSPSDIINKAQSIKANMGGCSDLCPGSIYKKYILFFANELALLFNQCLNQGVCPQEFKFATITPLVKKNPRSDPCNYRPISCVPFLAKLLESFLNDQIVAYLTISNYLHPKQFGFRKGCSSALALAHMYRVITAAWEKKQSIIAIFLDVEKAFDSLDRKILLNILEQIKFSKDALEFFKSYFQSRIQVTINGDSISDPCVSNLGVPQGTSLSPTLFLIYINSLLVTSKTDAICFADDVTLFYKIDHDTFDADVERVNLQLCYVENWYKQHRLCINAQKTRMLVFHPRQRLINQPISIKFSGHNIACTNEHKCLGVIWDSALTFKAHIDNTANQVKCIVPALARLANVSAPRYILLAAYNSLFLSYIRYCIIIYGSAAEVHLKKLQVLQNNAIRAIFRHCGHQGVTQLYNKYHLLKLKYLYKYELGVFAYKNFNERLPCDAIFYYARNANKLNNSKPKEIQYVHAKQAISKTTLTLLF